MRIAQELERCFFFLLHWKFLVGYWVFNLLFANFLGVELDLRIDGSRKGAWLKRHKKRDANL